MPEQPVAKINSHHALNDDLPNRIEHHVQVTRPLHEHAVNSASTIDVTTDAEPIPDPPTIPDRRKARCDSDIEYSSDGSLWDADMPSLQANSEDDYSDDESSYESAARHNMSNPPRTAPCIISPATMTYSLFHQVHPNPITLSDDDTFHGNTPTTPKPANHTRFLTKNVHHVSTNSTDDELRMHFGDQQRQEIDYFGIVEHRLDTQQYTVRQAFIDNARTTFRQHKIELGSSALHTVSTYKPGGTAIIAQGDATGRIIHQDSDKYGHWSYFHLKGKNARAISYITVYQVCKKPTNLQGITAYHQQ
jgi:hypothetical protein